MTERRQLAILGALSVGTVTCFGWLLLCPHRADCLNALTRFDTWLSAGTTIAVPLAGASMAVWPALLHLGTFRGGIPPRRLFKFDELPTRLVATMASSSG